MKRQSDPEQELRKKREQTQQKNTENVVIERRGKHQTSLKPGVSKASSMVTHDVTWNWQTQFSELQTMAQKE